MVKPLFKILDVDFWRHSGRLGVTEPSLCLHHAIAGMGAPILVALNELQAESPSRRTLTFAKCSRTSPLSSLRLRLVPKGPDLQIMNIRCDNDTATIEMTSAGCSLLVNAVIRWLEGDEDFGVSSRDADLKPNWLGIRDLESGELWFWGPEYAGA